MGRGSTVAWPEDATAWLQNGCGTRRRTRCAVVVIIVIVIVIGAAAYLGALVPGRPRASTTR
jgi:hypothetical protein